MEKRNKGITILLITLIFNILIAFPQEYINTRRISLYKGDTLIITNTLTSARDGKLYPNGQYYWYSSAGIHSNTGGFSGNLLHGDYSEYDKKGNMILKGTFEYGLKTGIWQKWYPSGSVKDRTFWKNGIREGKYEKYSTDGEEIINGEYHENKFSGIQRIVKSDSVYMQRYRNGIIKKSKIESENKKKLLSEQMNF